MKLLVLGCTFIAAATAVMTGQMPKYGVTATVEKGVDVAKFTTYSWTTGQPSAIKSIDARIVAAVDRELAALGFSKASSGPGDVLVAYYSVTRTDVNLKAKPDAGGLLPQSSVGTLMVALLRPTDRERLVRLRIDTPIDATAGKVEAAIDSAVAELFAHYPTRRRK